MYIYSFPPIAAENANTLILGTMPGKESLARQQYYAHPRNAFWPIMGELFNFDSSEAYVIRQARLMKCGIAVWDVLQSCIRTSSLDADIETESIAPNDFATFLEIHSAVQRICFNGAKAAQLFQRHVRPHLPIRKGLIEYVSLPSTSPAHASMNFAKKLQAWQQIIQ